MYSLLVRFKLGTGMDGFPFSCVGILMHDGYDQSFLGVNDSTCSYNRDCIDSVVVNTLYVNRFTGLVYDADVVSCNTAIGSTVNK